MYGVIDNGGFARGTRIATTEGDVEVELLRAGDELITEAGPEPLVDLLSAGFATAGVVIHAEAFGPGCPGRDLVLTAQHRLFLRDSTMPDGAVAPAGALVNGNTIVRVTEGPERAWFTPVLARSVVLVAEGVSVAGYRPEGMPPCAPAVPPGPALFALRRRVTQGEVNAALSTALKFDADLVLMVDGAVQIAERQDPWCFTIPPGATSLQLASPVGFPADSDDTRQFGVAITRIVLDGIPLSLAGPIAGKGFYQLEGERTNIWRWTDGLATLVLPAAPRPRRLEIFTTDWHQTLRRGGKNAAR